MSSPSFPAPSRRAVLGAGLVATLAGACQTTDLLPGRKRGRRIVVASDLDNPPFASVSRGGIPEGRDVEMMRALAEEMGRALEWQRMPFDELLPAAALGHVDVVCATLGKTEERAEHVLFSRPYFETHLLVVVRAEPGAPTTLAELAGLRVGGGAGTTSEKAVRERLPLARGVFEGEGSTAERLLSGELDAAAMDGPAAMAAVARQPDRLALLGETLAPERYCLVFPKDHLDLCLEFNRALSALDSRGELRALDARFGLASR